MLGVYSCFSRHGFKTKDEYSQIGRRVTGGKDIETKIAVKKLILSVTTLRKNSIGDNDLLIESGILDSLGILKLVTAIEEKFNVEVLDEELIPENFHTIRDITDFIGRKQRLK